MEGSFDAYMERAKRSGRLVVQPRMGFSAPEQMREGLRAVKHSGAQPLSGTITIDSYTRRAHLASVDQALAAGVPLNGYPIVNHSADVTCGVLDGLLDSDFPVQVRHGTASPKLIFEATAAAGLDALEGGPVSYSLPYSRDPLATSVGNWRDATRLWAAHGERSGVPSHLESFGGCMFGQLAPPGLLAALTVLECAFFRENGIASVSLSLTQGVHDDQDIGALVALSRLARRHLGDLNRHVVFYTFMGRFPQTPMGAERILRASARIAVAGGAHRLVVKTAAEAHGIPTIAQNVQALRVAREAADAADARPGGHALAWADVVEHEAETLITAVLRLASNVGDALLHAFATGVLDIPHVAHPAIRGLARVTLDATGALVWSRTGTMPIRQDESDQPRRDLDSVGFESVLDVNRNRYDLSDDE